MRITAGSIAERLGVVCEGDASRELTGLASVREAGPSDLTFLGNPRYAVDAERAEAGAILLPGSWDRPCAAAARLRVPDPDRAFALVAPLFAKDVRPPPPGIHPSAVVAEDVEVGREVSIGPCAVIESGAKIGDRCVIGALCWIGQDVAIGEDTRLYPQVGIRAFCRIGRRVILHNGVVIGSDGFGYTVDEKGARTKVPQQGIVTVGDEVEIGANTTIDRARFGRTAIGNGVKIDNLVQIAHNVTVGDHAVIVAQTGIAGSSSVGHHAILAGQVGITGHIHIGAGAVIGAQAGIHKDVPPGMRMWGTPAVELGKALRQHGYVQNLPAYRDRLRDLEKRLGALEKQAGAEPS